MENTYMGGYNNLTYNSRYWASSRLHSYVIWEVGYTPVLKYFYCIRRNWQVYSISQSGLLFITLAISKCYGKVRVLFFPHDNSLISRGNSHVSRVRGLVVRCLLFNPEVSCSNPWVCANFFTRIPKQKVLNFFGTMRLFRFVRLFFSKFLKCPQRVLLSIFLIFCKRTNVKKSQRVPFFRISALWDCSKFYFFFQKYFRLPYFFQKYFNVPKASSFQFFDILQQNECYKILKGPFITFFGTMRLSGNFKKIRKIFSHFLVLKDRFFKDRSFFYATFLKFVFTEAPVQFLQERKRFARELLKALRLTGDHQKCFRKILNFFLFSV